VIKLIIERFDNGKIHKKYYIDEHQKLVGKYIIFFDDEMIKF